MQDKITNYIQTELLSGQSNIQLEADEDLLTTGLIDSLGIMKLIAFLEQEFSITVPAEDMTIEHFLSVETMAEYVQSRQQ